jgi:hypothetical protein
LKEPSERKLSQDEIAEKLTKWTKQYPKQNIGDTTAYHRRKQTRRFANSVYHSNTKFQEARTEDP